MTVLDLIVFSFAAGGLVDLLLHGSVFADFRARMEAYGGWRATLFGCPYCLTYQSALWLLLLFWLVPALSAPEWLRTLAKFPVYFLAVARLTWALDGYLPAQAQYTRPSL